MMDDSVDPTGPPLAEGAGTDVMEASARPRRRRWPWIVTIGAVLAIGVGAAVAIPRIAVADAKPTSAPGTKVETEEVGRGDIVERVKTTGRLEYGGRRELTSALTGTVTSLAPVGEVVDRGGELARVDDRPIMLLRGSLPAWRGFEADMTDGRDVRQLEENLRDLGYFTREPDDRFDWDTNMAVRAWQEARGLPRTGELPWGSIVFSDQPLRIARHVASIGQPSGGAILGVSDTSKQVVLSLDPKLSDTAEVGAAASVTMPDGAQAEAHVARRDPTTSVKGEDGSTQNRVPVILTLDDPAASGDLSDATLPVELSRTLAKDVMRVPIMALLAGPDGTTLVEKETKTGTKRVAVTLGAFGDGVAEVAKGDIAAGDRVVVAQ